MGYFIVLEGPDGTGKSTLLRGIQRELEQTNLKVKYFREPGGCRLGEKIRALLLDPELEMAPATEALLFAANRSENYAQLKKDLRDYDLVIADRFLLSSLAYQGEGLGLGMDPVLQINDFALQGYRPDMHLLLLLDVEEGLKRKKKQKVLDRLERRKEEFHRKVTEGYLKLEKSGKYNIEIIDAGKAPEEILDHCMKVIGRFIPVNHEEEIL